MTLYFLCYFVFSATLGFGKRDGGTISVFRGKAILLRVIKLAGQFEKPIEDVGAQLEVFSDFFLENFGWVILSKL